jgi:hypothetical protein
VVGLPHVARADVEDAMGQAEVADQPHTPLEDLVEHVGGLLGRGVRQQLHLVELVHP